MQFIKTMFSQNYEHYEGVRPINIYLLRLFFLLIGVFVSVSSWSVLLNHTGEWNIVRAAAFSMWATYPTLSFIAVFKPLKWLPLMLFIVLYKIVWLFVVAYPLWSSNQLVGSSAEEMAGQFFIGAICLTIAVPWSYTFKTYLWPFGNK